MRESKAHQILLLVISVLLLTLGGWRLLDPVSFFANSGLVLSLENGLLSEARATGGVVVGYALVILFGVSQPSLRFTAALVAPVLFLSFLGGRLVGVVLDGTPGPELVQGMLAELLLGGLSMLAFVRLRRRDGAAG